MNFNPHEIVDALDRLTYCTNNIDNILNDINVVNNFVVARNIFLSIQLQREENYLLRQIGFVYVDINNHDEIERIITRILDSVRTIVESINNEMNLHLIMQNFSDIFHFLHEMRLVNENIDENMDEDINIDMDVQNMHM